MQEMQQIPARHAVNAVNSTFTQDMLRISRRVLALHCHACNRSLHANVPNVKSQRASFHARSFIRRICSMSKNSSMALRLPRMGSSMNSQFGGSKTVPAVVLSATACVHHINRAAPRTAQPSPAMNHRVTRMRPFAKAFQSASLLPRRYDVFTPRRESTYRNHVRIVILRARRAAMFWIAASSSAVGCANIHA